MQQPQHDLRPFTATQATPRRILSVGLVGLLHVVFIYALASGLAAQLIQKLPDELKAEVVTEKPPENPKTPPPPPPDLVKPPPPFVPPPDINIQNEAPATTSITQVTTQVKPAGITAPASVGRSHSCQDKYPPIAVRLGEEGTTALAFKITADGSVTDVTVSESSGHSDLDEAAVRCAGNWHYQPALQNGKPVEVPWQTHVKWSLKG